MKDIFTIGFGFPCSLIMVGVHGDEGFGVDALEALLPDLPRIRGAVTFIVGNPRALKVNKRFVEVDLNRQFIRDGNMQWSDAYEFQRAQTLKPYIRNADVLLDVHGSYTLRSKPFLICEGNAYWLAGALSIDTVVSGLDEVQPGGTDYYANLVGNVGISAECGYLGDPQALEVAKRIIKEFLIAREHIPGRIVSTKQTYYRAYEQYIAKDSFTLRKPFDDFDLVSKEGVLGMDGRRVCRAMEESEVLFARNAEKGKEAYVLIRKAASI